MTVLKVRDTDDGLTASESTEAFLNLSWEGDDSADEIIGNIRARRGQANFSTPPCTSLDTGIGS